MEFYYWAAPVGSLTLAVVLADRVAAVLLLAGWSGHKLGQFAFVTFDDAEEPHPYTIASDWNPESRCLKFVVKALGDHTRRVNSKVCEGMPVTVEGPYGGFDFEDDCSTQIWVGAGIGITPFIARMGDLARHSDSSTIYLFHPTADVSDEAIGKLRADAEAVGVNLIIRRSRTEGLLPPPQDIRDAGSRPVCGSVARWRQATLCSISSTNGMFPSGECIGNIFNMR